MKQFKKDIKTAERALFDLKAEAAAMEKRKALFDAGEPKALHQFDNKKEAQKAVDEAQQAVADGVDFFQSEKDKYAESVKVSKYKESDHEKLMKKRVRDEKTVLAHEEVWTEGRWMAFQKVLVVFCFYSGGFHNSPLCSNSKLVEQHSLTIC